MRQARGAGGVLFRLSLGIFFLFCFKPIPIFFFFFLSLSLFLLFPRSFLSIYGGKHLNRRTLFELTPASQASCVVPHFVPFSALLGPSGHTDYRDKPHPPGGAGSVLKGSLWPPELRQVRLLPWPLCLRVHVPQLISPPPPDHHSFGDRLPPTSEVDWRRLGGLPSHR